MHLLNQIDRRKQFDGRKMRKSISTRGGKHWTKIAIPLKHVNGWMRSTPSRPLKALAGSMNYETAFMHCWDAPTEAHGGDLIYYQGHCSPGIYARAFLEGRLSEEQLLNFRQEVEGKGLSSYPHPWLLPDFWQFPTVSMGLGPLMAIYQARFLKYLQSQKLAEPSSRKVWCFLGDGETDEPES